MTIWKLKSKAAVGSSSSDNAPVVNADKDADGPAPSPAAEPEPVQKPSPVLDEQMSLAKKRKVSLGSLLGKVKLEKKQVETVPIMDELVGSGCNIRTHLL